MKKGFTLIELLVVLAILVLIMGVIVPKGAKLLDSYQKYVEKEKSNQKLSKLRAKAFLEAENIYVKIEDKYYILTKKGVIIEKSYDHR